MLSAMVRYENTLKCCFSRLFGVFLLMSATIVRIWQAMPCGTQDACWEASQSLTRIFSMRRHSFACLLCIIFFCVRSYEYSSCKVHCSQLLHAQLVECFFHIFVKNNATFMLRGVFFRVAGLYSRWRKHLAFLCSSCCTFSSQQPLTCAFLLS